MKKFFTAIFFLFFMVSHSVPAWSGGTFGSRPYNDSLVEDCVKSSSCALDGLFDTVSLTDKDGDGDLWRWFETTNGNMRLTTGGTRYATFEEDNSNIDWELVDMTRISELNVADSADIAGTGTIDHLVVGGSTECAVGEFIDGDGSCSTSSDSYLPDDPATSNVDMNGQDITNAGQVNADTLTAEFLGEVSDNRIESRSSQFAIRPINGNATKMLFGDGAGSLDWSMTHRSDGDFEIRDEVNNNALFLTQGTNGRADFRFFDINPVQKIKFQGAGFSITDGDNEPGEVFVWNRDSDNANLFSLPDTLDEIRFGIPQNLQANDLINVGSATFDDQNADGDTWSVREDPTTGDWRLRLQGSDFMGFDDDGQGLDLFGNNLQNAHIPSDTVSSSITVSDSDVVLLNSGVSTVTLDTAWFDAGQRTWFKDADGSASGGKIDIGTSGGQKIFGDDARDTITLNSNGEAVEIYSDGKNGFVLNRYSGDIMQ